MTRSAICCLAMLAVPAFAADPHLTGTWKGTAERTVCGEPAGSREITLVLKDAGNSPHLAGAQDVMGELRVGSGASVPVALGFDAKTRKVSGSPMPTGFSLLPNDSAPAYRLHFQAGDAWWGVGYDQSLTGTVSLFNARCADLRDGGEVLTVKLNKQDQERGK